MSHTLTFTLQNGSPSNSDLRVLINTGSPISFQLSEAGNTESLAIGTCFIGTDASFVINNGETAGREYSFVCALDLYDIQGAI